MTKRYARILAAGGAAVLAVALGVPAALAAGTWTVQPGRAITAMSGKFVFVDTTNGTVGTCASTTAGGTLKSGSGLPARGAGSLSAVSFAQCSGAAGPQFALRPGGLPWHVNLSSYNAAKGVARGTISHLHITVGGSGCDAMIDGSSATAHDGRVAFRYTNSTGHLRVLKTGGNLHLYEVTAGCLGLFEDGDTAALAAIYTVSPKQAITSP